MTKGKTLVTEGKTLVTKGKALVTEGKTFMTKGKAQKMTLVSKGNTSMRLVEAREKQPIGPLYSSLF